MTCLTLPAFGVPSLIAAALWVVCALVLTTLIRSQRIAGKAAFVLTLSAMLWWLAAVTFDLGSYSETCKVSWSLAAWPGIALLPVAWSFFLFDYTLNPRRETRRWRPVVYAGLPLIVGLIAATNGFTHLLYGTGNQFVADGTTSTVIYDHGPLFYAVAAVLYVFVTAALCVLAYAFIKAKKNIRPFLGLLFLITAAPITANLAYIGWGFTMFGFDPTPFMFAVALITLSWLILNNSMMDTLAQGRSRLFYATSDPVILIDGGGHYSGANPAALALFGHRLPREGASMARVEGLGPLVNYFRHTGDRTYPEPIKILDRIFEPRALPIESPIQTEGNLLGWAISLIDITERERSAEALRDALARAEAANQAKSQFLAMISHELRTPMTSVKGGLDLALHGAVGELNEPLHNLLTIAKRNSLRLLKLIDDVLDLQKLDLSAITLDQTRLDADTFLRDVVEEYEGFASETGVTLTIASPDVEHPILADPNRLKQVVGNVISNAVKFSPKGGRVECTAEIVGAHLRFAIKDSGVGIPAQSEDTVFGRFHQVESTVKQGLGGSGLGLHIAKLLIERMGGTIRYESELGRGTTFFIEVPLAARVITPVETVVA